MNASMAQQPLVLSLSHSDPTGGSGIQADIETIASLGCYCTPIITATVPYTKTVSLPAYFTKAESVIAQIHAVIADLPIAAIKIGLLDNLAIVDALAEILALRPDIKVVFNPHRVPAQTDKNFYRELFMRLGPHIDVACMSGQMLRALCSSHSEIDHCVMKMARLGVDIILVTGTHESTPLVINSLYQQGELLETFSWERLQTHFHGAGDTLSAAIAAILAHGTDAYFAVQDAQQYTWECLTHSNDLGIGMSFPNRLFWAQDDVHEHNITLN